MKFWFIIGLLNIFLSVAECGQEELSVQPSSLVATVGESVTVQCHANKLRHAPKSIYWIPRKPGNNFYQHRINVSTTSFHIQRLRHSDAGLYRCVLITIDNTEIYSNLNLYVVRRRSSYHPICGHTRFRCQKTDECIFLRYRCDGIKDCSDGSDEQNCQVICRDKFRCSNGRCIDTVFLCDRSDNCGDQSDELLADCMANKEGLDGVTQISTVTPTVSDADHFNWLKETVYIVIGCTVALVIFISFIVLIVFRVKMKRLRARRMARAMERHRRHQSGGQNGRSAEHEAFLPVSSNSLYGNIIVNVNNGVQYVPNPEFGTLMEAPPSYAEVVGSESSYRDSPPPAYSTIDRNPKTVTSESATNTSRNDLTSPHPTPSSIQAIEENPDPHPNIFTNVEGAFGPVGRSSASGGASGSASANQTTNSNAGNASLANSSSDTSNPTDIVSHQSSSAISSPRSSAIINDTNVTPSNIFMCVEGAVSPLNRPGTSGEVTPVATQAAQRPQNSVSPQNTDTGDTEDLGLDDEDMVTTGSGQLAVRGGKIYLRSDSSNSTTAVTSPLKGNLDVKGGQIVLKAERPNPRPQPVTISDAPPRSHESSDEGSLGRGALEIREGRILLR